MAPYWRHPVENACTQPPRPRPLPDSGSAVLSADRVALAIMRGVERNRFLIAPGLEMAALARLHSLIGPLLNRFWFDPVVKRWHNGGPSKPAS